MTLSRKLLCAIYTVIAVVALIGTWGNNTQYLGLHLGFLGTNTRFWQDTLVNPASRSITVDLLLLMLAAVVWMLLEARRLGMKGVWLYIVLGALVAISVTFPAFLIHRERALAARENADKVGQVAGRLESGDVFGLLVLAVIGLTYTYYALVR